jgi:release factor glutamine methyltransferase
MGQALRVAARHLADANVDAPGLAAEALLAHSLDLSRAHILARLEQPLSVNQLARYQSLIDRCTSGEPMAYVIGHREFYGLDFLVDPRVLIPRPETELLVELTIATARARAQPGGSDYRIADIGTGSGAIAVALAVHLPEAQLIATDLSPAAIEVARENARRHQVADRIEFKVGDLLTPIEDAVDVIVANLPYIRSREWSHLAQSIRGYEPACAFNGGADGLELVHRLLTAAPAAIRRGGSILLEIGAAHGEAALELARDVFAAADLSIQTDYAGLDRALMIRTS